MNGKTARYERRIPFSLPPKLGFEASSQTLSPRRRKGVLQTPVIGTAILIFMSTTTYPPPRFRVLDITTA